MLTSENVLRPIAVTNSNGSVTRLLKIKVGCKVINSVQTQVEVSKLKSPKKCKNCNESGENM